MLVEFLTALVLPRRARRREVSSDLCQVQVDYPPKVWHNARRYNAKPIDGGTGRGNCDGVPKVPSGDSEQGSGIARRRAWAEGASYSV